MGRSIAEIKRSLVQSEERELFTYERSLTRRCFISDLSVNTRNCEIFLLNAAIAGMRVKAAHRLLR